MVPFEILMGKTYEMMHVDTGVPTHTISAVKVGGVHVLARIGDCVLGGNDQFLDHLGNRHVRIGRVDLSLYVDGQSSQSKPFSYDENTLATPYPSHSVGKRSKVFPIIMLKIDLNNWFIYRSMMYHYVSLRISFFSELGSRCAWVSDYARQTLCSDLSAAQHTGTSLELNNSTHLEKLLVLQLTPS